MADQELSTRDLANRSESAGAEGSLETEPSADPTDAKGEPQLESAPSEEPLLRERAAESGGRRDDAGDASASGHDGSGQPATSTTAAEREPLLPSDQSERFTMRWQEIQSSFVDEPRDAVAEADALVADLMQRLAAGFSNERERLEAQWDQGEDVSTEDLRVALTRYRSFFDRLLSA